MLRVSWGKKKKLGLRGYSCRENRQNMDFSSVYFCCDTRLKFEFVQSAEPLNKFDDNVSTLHPKIQEESHQKSCNETCSRRFLKKKKKLYSKNGNCCKLLLTYYPYCVGGSPLRRTTPNIKTKLQFIVENGLIKVQNDIKETICWKTWCLQNLSHLSLRWCPKTTGQNIWSADVQTWLKSAPKRLQLCSKVAQ